MASASEKPPQGGFVFYGRILCIFLIIILKSLSFIMPIFLESLLLSKIHICRLLHNLYFYRANKTIPLFHEKKYLISWLINLFLIYSNCHILFPCYYSSFSTEV